MLKKVLQYIASLFEYPFKTNSRILIILILQRYLNELTNLVE